MAQTREQDQPSGWGVVRQLSRLLVLSDRHQGRRPLDTILQQVLEAGCRWISLREKDLPHGQRCELLSRLVGLGARYQAIVSVHGDIEAARAAGADGVHLPAGSDPRGARERLGAAGLIGVSAHSLDEAITAAAAGADYVTLSPVFASPSKPGYGPALGPDALAEIARRVSIPVVALGGITAERAPQCLAAGAAAIAVMGSVMRAPHPGVVVEELLAAVAARA